MVGSKMIEKVVSGGQTGVDRAGLDAAMEAGIPVGGYCPKGRLSEDGTVPECYPLIELTRGGYPARTEKNVVESDGTLVLNLGRVSGGTRVTVECARKHGRPILIVPLDNKTQLRDTLHWLELHGIRVLNVAGPRESKCPGVYRQALDFLRQLFKSAVSG
jgi:predicted Rossmann fold nucleotide-binding protein DprA/Smf involved in DNA uptake